MASSRDHSNAADASTRRSQKASDVAAEKDKMKPFEKARADLVKRNDKLDRDQAAKEQEMTKALEGQKKLKKRLEKAKAVRGRRPVAFASIGAASPRSRHRRDATRSSLDHTLSEHRPAPTSRRRCRSARTS